MPLSRRRFLQGSGAVALASTWPHPIYPMADPVTASLCRKLASDPLRPQYHLIPAHNWMNDPNGPIYFRGRYHMFHQYNPQSATWGNMNWAHATSPDMLHWQHEPIALSPTPGGPDADGVFSGSAVLDHGTPTVIYTAVAPPSSGADATLRDGVHTWRETQCLAVAQHRDLRTWKKIPTPVIASPPAGLEVTGFRDPALWREGENWMLVLGSGVRGEGGMVLLYTSTDLRHWTYLHPLVEGSPSKNASVNPVDTGEMWECPDFFPLGNKHVLLISTMGKVFWKVGTYKDQRFSPEKEGVVDWGSYYAAKSMLDADGNRILWGWIPETRPEAEYNASGWAGVMSLPRVLSLSPGHELQMQVVPAAQKLRGAHFQLTDSKRDDLNQLRISDLAAELKVEFHHKPDSEFALNLVSEAGASFASIRLANQSGHRELRVNDRVAAITGNPSDPVRLHLFLDSSVLEVFVHRTAVVTSRVYQATSGPLRVTLEGRAESLDLHAWQMNPISSNRLTSPLCD